MDKLGATVRANTSIILGGRKRVDPNTMKKRSEYITGRYCMYNSLSNKADTVHKLIPTAVAGNTIFDKLFVDDENKRKISPTITINDTILGDRCTVPKYTKGG